MGGGFFRPEVTKHIYPGFCCRDSAGSADGLGLRADRGLSRQLLYHMANMGMELFEPNWINAIVLFFSCLGWAIFAANVVVCAFECGMNTPPAEVICSNAPSSYIIAAFPYQEKFPNSSAKGISPKKPPDGSFPV